MNTNSNAISNELTTVDFQQMDHLDEQQMLAEFRGELLEQFVYAFSNGGRQVVGISWAGIKQLANRMGQVQLDLLQMVDNREGWAVVVKAIGPDNASRLGAAYQPRLMKVRGEEQEDPFALPKAISKAQRNAIRALLPETLITEAIKAWLAEYRPGSSGSNGNGNGHKPPQLPTNGNGNGHISIAPKLDSAAEEARSILVPEGKSKGKKLGDLDRSTWQIIAGDAYKPSTPDGLRFKQAAALLLAQAA